MRRYSFLIFFIILLISTPLKGQFWSGDTWYNNPLGFEPLKLHTSMGILLPAAAAGIVLLLTGKDSSASGKLSVFNETGFSWGYKYPETFIPNNNTGINYQLRDFLSAGAEFSVFLPSDDFNSTAGFAIRPFFRFYPVNNDIWNIYFESGAGLIYTTEEFPLPTDRDVRGGLKLNGITKYGLGAAISVSGNYFISCSIKHLHISNGNVQGQERNPSHDSNGFYLSISKKIN
ncbi:MAG: acyloxyacyl hydrolase [Ignavibacteriaceae bacterium]|nr:acyloxyacyl hydrolase [Ignavibacteriaceae bacterium]